GDTWVWDGANWTQEFPANNPPGRTLPAMAYDQARNQVVLFGGFTGSVFANDTWVFGAPAVSTCTQLQLPPAGNGATGTTSSGDPTSSSTNAGALQLTGGEPVSTGSGNYYYSHTDFTLPGRGMSLVFRRSYNTIDNYSGPLGTFWTHSYNILLAET